LLELLGAPEYRDLSPPQIVPRLADAGIYLASEATLYGCCGRPSCCAIGSAVGRAVRGAAPSRGRGPNRVWSWDISYLPTTVRGLFFYLYLVVDLYSRKIVGWQVHDQESGAAASALLTEACQVEGVARDQLVLHADNGAPMKGATLLATLQALGVMPSFSRPSVSDDNRSPRPCSAPSSTVPGTRAAVASLARPAPGSSASSPGTTTSTATAPSASSPRSSAMPARTTRCWPSATSCTR